MSVNTQPSNYEIHGKSNTTDAKVVKYTVDQAQVFTTATACV